jgi:hypothetical protein
MDNIIFKNLIQNEIKIDSKIKNDLVTNDCIADIKENFKNRKKYIKILFKISKLIKEHDTDFNIDIVCHAVCMFDHYLFYKKANNPYLLILTILYISSKYIDDYHEYGIGIDNLLEITEFNFTVSDIKKMEIDIFKTINWKLEVSSIFDYMSVFSNKIKTNLTGIIKKIIYRILRCNECARQPRYCLALAILNIFNIIENNNCRVFKIMEHIKIDHCHGLHTTLS